MTSAKDTWTGSLFVVGSTCFLVGPFPGFAELVGARADAAVFFVGSLFFTSAATLQWLPARPPGGTDWWSSAWQLVGTLFFNVTTFRALDTAVGAADYNQVVWRPDAFGSVCFLVSGALAYVGVGGSWRRLPPRTADGRMASVNLAGCVAFGVSAAAAYVVPSTAEALDAGVANATTALGALAFLIGALLLIRQSRRPAASR
ncbi:hypothetical protein GCM10009844_01060 [Nocardioides koreensis]|uniref:YrhK domain-containing protein n=1 Tax=Nocardioides koreensis TaxID=433651 RepID=A0ABN2Z280_9ACTN